MKKVILYGFFKLIHRLLFLFKIFSTSMNYVRPQGRININIFQKDRNLTFLHYVFIKLIFCLELGLIRCKILLIFMLSSEKNVNLLL